MKRSSQVMQSSEDTQTDTSDGALHAAKKVWRKSEDLFIAGAVQRFGTQWPQIAAHLPGRSDDAVRNRWHRLQKTHQKPLAHAECEALLETAHAAVQAIVIPESSDRSRAPWTADEDRIIEDGVALHGLKWRLIVAQLPGRSDSSARNRWLRMQKERHDGSGAAEHHTEDSRSPECSATPSPSSSPSSPQPPEPLSTPKARPALSPGSPQSTWPPVAVELAPSAPALILPHDAPTLMRYSYFAAGVPIASVLPLSH